MKRRSPILPQGFCWRTVVSALLMGAVTTIGVAWGIALRGVDHAPLGIHVFSFEETFVDIEELRGTGWSRRWWHLKYYTGLPFVMHRPNERRYEGADVDRQPLRRFIDDVRAQRITPQSNKADLAGSDDSRGWPWLALSCDAPGRNTTTGSFTGGGLVLDHQPRRRGWFGAGNREALVIPFRPLWPGFALDTIVYGALWAALLTGVASLRAHHRLRHGRCPRCTYDLTHNIPAGCPECGWNRSPTPRAA